MDLNLTAIVVALIGASAGLLSYVQAAAARRDARREAASVSGIERESDAYDRARKIDDAVVERLEAELDRLSNALVAAHTENTELRRQLRDLAHELARLEATLDAAGIAVRTFETDGETVVEVEPITDRSDDPPIEEPPT